MHPLPHLRAFEQLVGTPGPARNAVQLRDLVAFGLYVEAECRYAQGLSPNLKASDVAHFNAISSTSEALAKLQQEATGLLNRFGGELIATAQKQFISNAVVDAVEAVHGLPRSFWYGAREAIAGSAIYSAILVVASILAHRVGLDLLEIYKRAAGAD